MPWIGTALPIDRITSELSNPIASWSATNTLVTRPRCCSATWRWMNASSGGYISVNPMPCRAAPTNASP